MNWIKIYDGAEMPGDGEKVLLRVDVFDVINNIDITACRKNGFWVDSMGMPLEEDVIPFAWQPYSIEPPKQ